MRLMAILPLLLVLAGCGGGSSSAEPRYDAERAMNCIRGAQPAETFVSALFEKQGLQTILFGEDRYDYEGYVLVVGYGADHAAASAGKARVRETPFGGFRSDVAFSNEEGNVVYEALGPSTRLGDVKVLPHGLTPDDVRRRSEKSAHAMEDELQKCLAAARKS